MTADADVVRFWWWLNNLLWNIGLCVLIGYVVFDIDLCNGGIVEFLG